MLHFKMCNIILCKSVQYWRKDQQLLLGYYCQVVLKDIRAKCRHHKWALQQDCAPAHTAHNTIDYCQTALILISNEFITDSENLTRRKTEKSDNHWIAKTITTFHWQHQWVASSFCMSCEEWWWTYLELKLDWFSTNGDYYVSQLLLRLLMDH